MSNSLTADEEIKSKILRLMDENHNMCVATVRSDGWPQATMVGYLRKDLAIYFVVARDSQKFANIQADSRVSIALGHDAERHIRGLSIAARAVEVTDPTEIEEVNALALDRDIMHGVFSPRKTSAALMRATPSVISIIDLAKGPGEPELFEVEAETVLRRVQNVRGHGSDLEKRA